MREMSITVLYAREKMVTELVDRANDSEGKLLRADVLDVATVIMLTGCARRYLDFQRLVRLIQFRWNAWFTRRNQ